MDVLQFKSWLNSFHHSIDLTHQRHPLIMGVLNITPDSFSDGGHYLNPKRALSQARQLIAAGVDVIDIGGESTRPGALPVNIDEELTRVIPVIELIRQESSVCISIDTHKAQVMQAAINAGANLINDVTGLQSEESLSVAASLDVPICLMHIQGIPKTMQDFPHYDRCVIDEINSFFELQIKHCLDAGIRRENLIIDPGFGFGKTVQHNLLLLKDLEQFKVHQLPILLGVSRKSTLGTVVNKPVEERLIAGIAVAVWASLQGIALIRTHDVNETKQALSMMDAILNISSS